jgi:hypothetical protein
MQLEKIQLQEYKKLITEKINAPIENSQAITKELFEDYLGAKYIVELNNTNNIL